MGRGFSQWVVEVASLLVCDALSSGVQSYAPSDTSKAYSRSAGLKITCVIGGFRRDVNEILELLVCYAAYVGSYRRFGTWNV